MKSKYVEAWNFMEVYIIYTTTYVCKQRVVALLLMELLSKMRKMRTITSLVLKYGTDVVSNLQTVVWLGLPESFVHNLALSFAHKHLCR